MPIVKEGTIEWDQMIEPLNLTLDIPPEAELPDLVEAVKASGGTLKITAQQGATKDANSISNIANQLGVGGIAQSIGIPTSLNQWGGAKDFFWNFEKGTNLTREELKIRFISAFENVERTGEISISVTNALKDMGVGDYAKETAETLFQSFEDAIGPAMGLLSGVADVAGTFVPIIGAFAKFVKVMISLNRLPPEPPEAAFSPLKYNSSNDRWFANQYFLGAMRGKSPIGNLFHPISHNLGDAKRLVNDDGSEIPGRRLDGSNWTRGEAKKWAGFMPGTLLLDRGWEISTDGTIDSGTRPVGSILPTGQNLGSKLWGMVAKPGSPLMYTVDTAELRAAWIEYLFNLRWKVENWGYWDESAKRAFINGPGMVYGWSPYPCNQYTIGCQGNNTKIVPYGNGTRLVDKDKSYGLLNTHVIKALDNLEMLQRGAMDNTLVCAYVDDSTGDLGWGARFHIPDKDRWHDNRMLLLQHPDRCKVDVQSIPDKDYRNAMIDAKLNCAPTGGMFLKANPIRPNAPPTVDVLQKMSFFPGATEEAVGEGSTGRGGLLLAAAALGLIVLSQKKR